MPVLDTLAESGYTETFHHMKYQKETLWTVSKNELNNLHLERRLRTCGTNIEKKNALVVEVQVHTSWKVTYINQVAWYLVIITQKHIIAPMVFGEKEKPKRKRKKK